ncbi:uncharacterized protein [Penaeus vannamei]|uniref:uncharacterized protein isoform X3 n=1 Tax=Penaeus vannamei TaxID=6689 RepID=UPI00387FADAC
MEALVLWIFVTGIYGASPRDDRLLAVQECPADTPWGSGNFSHADCDVRDPLACNGLGTCDCGTCKCKERDNPEETVSGRRCECTNFLCNNFLGLYCSGPDHGQCVCNKCECKPGWTGEDCGCSESVENCKNPLTGEICSNQGICECNSCRQCDFVKRGRCSGKWCENCPDPDRRRRHRNKEEREQRRRERKQRKKQRNGAVSEGRNSTAELCPKDTPWGPEAFDDSSCKETRASSPCSGRGTCTCGQCSCDSTPNHLEIISGQFCECTNFLCDRHNGLLCSGPDHGECICNRCRCKPGWTGEACECEESVENCRNPETGEICSNQGICECNMCRCSASAGGRYSGKWCEDCPTCRGSCLEYKSCVQCQAFGTGDLSEDECMQECKLFNSTMVQVAREETEEERLCTFFDENECRFYFVYGYDEDRNPIVRVQETLDCPPTFGAGAGSTAVSERRDSTAELCPKDTPWGPEAFDDSSCKETRASSPCSGRGTCACGQCSCDSTPNHLEIISGQFCECTNFLCDRHNGLLCSGPDHGECICNRCRCKPGWTGEACECEESVENCRNPVTGEICSNQGICECNMCRCSASAGGRYSGKWCEDCPTCRGSCLEYKSCVQCQAFGTGDLSEDECMQECKLFNSTMVQVAREEIEEERLCTFFDENDCRFTFVYGYDDERDPVVRVKQTLECPPPSFGRGAGSTAVSERRDSTAELCPKDTPWGPEAFDDSSCKETRASSPCSGRGTCACGQCSCDSTPNHLEIISGQFCECTNFLCDRHNGLLCSGPDHGECICNRCRCKPGWTGEACECEESVENCRNPETGEICSNQGICECNMCRCSASAGGRYSGKWCEDCPTCRGSCLEYKSCVQCQAFGTGDLSEDECMQECKLFNSTMVQVAREEIEEERLCTFFDENDCRFTFVYGYDDERDPVVRVKQTLECPPPSFGRGTGNDFFSITVSLFTCLSVSLHSYFVFD